MLEIKPIKTETEHRAALAEVERLFDAKPGTPAGNRLEIWTTLIEAYESRQYVIPLPDPIEAILYHLESRGLSRRDLEPFIGSRARVAEVLNRRRALSITMVRNLNQGLGISADVLLQSYRVAKPLARQRAQPVPPKRRLGKGLTSKPRVFAKASSRP